MKPFRRPLLWILSSLWKLLVLLLLGPLFVEWLDQHHLSNQILGLPVIVTEVVLLASLSMVGIGIVFLWQRGKSLRGGAG